MQCRKYKKSHVIFRSNLLEREELRNSELAQVELSRCDATLGNILSVDSHLKKKHAENHSEGLLAMARGL